MSKLGVLLGCVAVTFAIGGCRPDPPEPAPMGQFADGLLKLPEGWSAPEFPEDNAFTDARWALGKDLFFDERLSVDGSVSCASCHLSAQAFSAPEAITPGALGVLGTRNAPTLTNVAYQPHFMSEGGVPTLEMQVLVPLQEPSEMGHNIVTACEELASDYAIPSQTAYGRELDPFVMTRALATFQRSMLSGDSPWDRWQRGAGGVSEAVEQGAELFGAAGLGCDRCHTPPLFTNHGFANNGLDAVSTDPGRWVLTGDPADSGAFKVPTLRNIGYTAPYMHDGRFQDLDDVVDHYMSGGAGHAHQDSALVPFGLTEEEKSNLVAFLHALSDTAFVNDARWYP
ncbi:cytochrome-c peroxidase [Flavobacteriales bacterium]|nr:cytochrome-c peroxidase [Flavobacteriales bacterium]